MKEKRKRVIIKSILCFIYLGILGILLFGSFKLYRDKEEIRHFSEIESMEEYTYIEVSQMSEKFKYSKETNIGYHIALDKETLYIVMVNESDLEDLKAVIDYTNGKTKKKPDSVKIYGYPVPGNDKVKEEFMENGKDNPLTKELEMTPEKYDSTFNDVILDSTKEEKEEFNIVLFATLLLSFIVFILLFLTIIDKDKIVDTIVEEEKEEIKPKKKKH